jgi:hypothetical protein
MGQAGDSFNDVLTKLLESDRYKNQDNVRNELVEI